MADALKTLIVEDDSSSRIILKAALDQRGHDVTSCASAEAAWAACQHQAFELALIDWMLPGMDGLGLCRKIRELPWGDRVVLLVVTARDKSEDLNQVLMAEADDYLAKPFSLQLLNVRLTVAERRLHDIVSRKQAEDALQRAHDALEAEVAERTAQLQQRVSEMTVLSRLSEKVTASLALDKVVQATLNGLAEVVDCDLTLLHLRQGDQFHLYSFRSSGDWLEGDEEPVHRVGGCLCGLAIKERETIHSTDIRCDSRCANGECKVAGVRSFVALPLISGDQAFGVLGLASIAERDFAPHLDFLQAVASQVAIGIDNALLYSTLEATLNALPDQLFEVAADGVIHGYRGRRPELFFHPPEEFIGKNVRQVFPPDAAEVILAGLAEACQTGSHTGAIYSLQTPAGVAWFELSITARDGAPQAQPDRFVALARDISKRKQAEEEQRLLSTAIEQSTEGVVITAPDGTIRYVNPAIERMTGYSRQDLVGANSNLLKSGKHDRPFYRHLWQTILAGRVWSGHFINRRADGTLYEENASIFPISDEEGKIINFVGLKWDVTEQMMLERRTRHARRMEAVGQFASGIAHDFNNLLMIIQGSADLLERGGAIGEHGREGLAIIGRTTRDGAQLTRSLLAFSRQQVLTPVDLDLNEMIAQMLPMLERLLQDDVLVTSVPGPDLDNVHGDRVLLQQVVLNLCSNASDAMRNGGEITIETGNIMLDEADMQDYPGAQPGPHVFFSVADDGVGMDAETLSQVLNPFFTTKEPDRGTGLGLTSALGTVKQHGGVLDVHSLPGVGTKVVVLLKASARREQESEPTAVAVESPGRSVTVMVVEDHPSLRRVMVALLESIGHRVLVAADGVEALAGLEARAGEVALVISDVSMPRMGGGELYRRSRQLFPGLRFLFCSGNMSNWERLGCRDDPMVGYLQKPFDIAALSQKVRQILKPGGEPR